MSNRIIKFRVWTGMDMEYAITTGKFGTFFVNPGGKGDGLDPKDSACLTPFNTKYNEPVNLMQFTGISHKDGEWYEGDIIENDGNRYEIVWDDTEARFEAVSTHGGDDVALGEVNVIGTFKIGTIYENPDLLK